MTVILFLVLLRAFVVTRNEGGSAQIIPRVLRLIIKDGWSSSNAIPLAFDSYKLL